MDDLNPDKEPSNNNSSTAPTTTTNAKNGIHNLNDNHAGLFSTPGGGSGGGVKSSSSSSKYSTATAAAAAASTSFYRPFFTDPTPTKKDALSSVENDDGENLGRSWSNDDNNNNVTDHISLFVPRDYNYSPNQHNLHSKKLTATPSIGNSLTATTTTNTATKTP